MNLRIQACSLNLNQELGIHHTINSYKSNMEGSITIFSEGGTIKIGGQYLNTIDYQSTNGFELKHEAETN